MARRTIVALEDDLDGGPADETVRFGVGGSEYEIDLSEKNAAKLRKQLAPFVEHARRGSGQSHRPVRTAASRRRSRDIRAWAREQGIQLSERGRIPAGIAAQYEAEAGRSSRRLAAGRRAHRRLAPCPRRAGIFPNANAWFGSAGRRAPVQRAEQPGELEFARGEQGGLAELAGFGAQPAGRRPGWPRPPLNIPWPAAARHDIVGGEVALDELAEGGAVHVWYSFRASRLVLTSPARGAHGES